MAIVALSNFRLLSVHFHRVASISLSLSPSHTLFRRNFTDSFKQCVVTQSGQMHSFNPLPFLSQHVKPGAHDAQCLIFIGSEFT